MRTRPLILSFLALSATGLLLSSCDVLTSPEDKKAQSKLDNILGETPSLPDYSQPNPPNAKGLAEQLFDQLLPKDPETETDPNGSSNNGLFSFGLPQINITEEADAYKINVPLDNPDDEKSVQVNVHPHRIEVQGQRSFGQGGFQGSSSFMKSFNTQAELAPDKISRQQDQDILVIIVPKKSPEASDSAPLPNLKQPTRQLPQEKQKQLNPNVLKQLQQGKQHYI